MQAIWHLSERWALTPGVRFNWESKTADLSGDSVCTAPPICVMRIALSAKNYKVQGLSRDERSEEHTSELQSLMRISYAVFCLKKKNNRTTIKVMNNKYKKNIQRMEIIGKINGH